MNAPHERLLGAFETHDVDAIRAVLDAGFDAASRIDGKPAVTHLIEMYWRSDGFPACPRLMLERGARLDDPRMRTASTGRLRSSTPSTPTPTARHR